MNYQGTDFYLTTAGEYGPLTEPRACSIRGRLRDRQRDDYYLVAIEPAALLRLSDREIRASELLLATKWKGISLDGRWPIPVYVIAILDDTVHHSRSFRAEQVRMVAWGALYATVQDATEAAKGFRDD